MSRCRERVAICGLGLRTPGKGGVDSPEKFWNLLINGEDASDFVPSWKWNNTAFYNRSPGRIDKVSVARGNFVDKDKMTEFDANFFRMSTTEAELMDPQQRCALQCALEAMWDAGVNPEAYSGQPVDVIVGTMHTEYVDVLDQLTSDQGAGIIGNARTMAPNRLSYFFNFRGRSLSVDTACSSSLQALDLVVEGLQQHKSEMGIVIGTNFMASVNTNLAFEKLGTISSDGRSKYCDAGADGYGRGEAAVVLVVKRLHDAIRDGNTIYCTLVDAKSNHDGAKDFPTFPSREAQHLLMDNIYRENRLDPRDTQYVEAHGTGTDAGDKTELAAVHGAMIDGRGSRPGNAKLVVGSVKTNIGHTEGAAGACSVAKCALMLYHKRIPGSLHLGKLHPEIPLEDYGIDVPQSSIEWPMTRDGMPRRVSINSFGIGGSNTHVILEEFRGEGDAAVMNRHHVSPIMLPLSAHNREALKAWIQLWVEFLTDNSKRFSNNINDFKAAVNTVIQGRSHLNERICILGDSAQELSSGLQYTMNVLKGGNEEGNNNHQQASDSNGQRNNENKMAKGKFNCCLLTDEQTAVNNPKLLFIFSGQGTQYPLMGMRLYQKETVFRTTLDHCASLVKRWDPNLDIVKELEEVNEDSKIYTAPVALVLIPALQMALVELLKSKGVKPAGALGHSSGEVAAAYCAGALPLDSAMWLAYQRSVNTQKFAKSPLGDFEAKMLAVGLSEKDAIAMMEELNLDESVYGRICIAAINSPLNVTLSGDGKALDAVEAWCKDRSLFTRFLRSGAAFHSHHMLTASLHLQTALENTGSKFEYQRTSIPLFSTVTGTCVSGRKLDAEYWKDNLQHPVKFWEAVTTAMSTHLASPNGGDGQNDRFNMIVEIGPHPALSGPAKQILAELSSKQRNTPTVCPMDRKMINQEDSYFYKFLGDMYVHGCSLQWDALFYWPSPTHEPMHWIPRYDCM